MKKFLLHLLLFTTLVTAVLAGVLFFAPDPVAKNCMLADEIGKIRYLENISGRRLVLVGGSNLLYGVDSLELERALKIPVCNMGLHAGLGLCYQLESVLPYIHAGDLVVVSPEYSNFAGDAMFGGEEIFNMVLNIRPCMWNVMDLRQKIHALQYAPDFAARKISRVVCRQKVQERKYLENCTERGDLVDELPDDAAKTFRIGKRMTAEDFNASALKYLMEFAAGIKTRGANVVLMPPCRAVRSFERQRDFIDRVELELRNAGLPFAADPERYSMAMEYFFNTDYHLNLNGRRLRTKMMIEDLR